MRFKIKKKFKKKKIYNKIIKMSVPNLKIVHTIKNLRQKINSVPLEKKGTDSVSYLNHTYTFNPKNNLYYVFNPDEVLTEEEPDITFRFTDIHRLSDETWNNLTDDIIVFEGVRYKPSSDIQTLYFRETIQIKTADGSSIRASAIYEDSGNSELTTVSTVFFPVECASGKFKDIKIIKFNYFNDYEPNKKVRTLELLI